MQTFARQRTIERFGRSDETGAEEDMVLELLLRRRGGEVGRGESAVRVELAVGKVLRARNHDVSKFGVLRRAPVRKSER